MKYWVAFFILYLCTLQTFGQQEYFVYLQTENNQPFYVRVDNAVYSSSSSGYFILTRSKNTDPIAITIGFPKNLFPEQKFNITVTGKDAGYIIKDMGEKGWALYNLQTLATLMNINPPVVQKNTALTGIRKTDDFSVLLSNAVNDTAVLYAVVKPPKPIVSPVTEEKKDSALATTDANVNAKDSIATAKLNTAKDSSMKDSSSLVISNIQLQKAKEKEISKPIIDSVAKTPTADTSNVVKTVTPVTQPQNPIVKDSQTVKAKPVIKPGRGDSITLIESKKPGADTVAKNKEKKDTIIMMNGDNAVASAANKSKERKDTIIMMNSTKPSGTDVAKNKQKKDSIIVQKGKAVDENKSVAKNIVTPPVVQKDTASEKIQKTDAPALNTEKQQTIADVPVKKSTPHIFKAAEFRTDTSYVAIFIDEAGDDADTIRVSVPFREPADDVAKKEDIKPAAIANKPGDTAVTAPKPISKDSAQSATVTTVQKPVLTVKKDSAIASTDTGKPNKGAPVMVNSDCKDEATDVDIDKLRVKMLLVNTDDDRIALARRLFRLKCFSVKQVKALTELFKADEGRYKWFDAVYPFVSDSSNFSSLSEFLKNDYYLNRFKAMLRN